MGNPDRYDDKVQTLNCECGCGALSFELDFPDIDRVVICYYPWGGQTKGFWQRVKVAWDVLKNRPNSLYDLIVDRERLFSVACHMKMRGREHEREQIVEAIKNGEKLDDR